MAKKDDDERVIAEFEERFKDKIPKNWDTYSKNQKLEFFAHRMLLDAREEIRETEGNQAAKDWGFMSDYQIERRRRREVLSNYGSLNEIPPTQGVFSRTYRKKD